MKKLIILLTTITLMFSTLCYADSKAKIILPAISKSEALTIARNYVAIQSPQLQGQLDLDKTYSIIYKKSAPNGYNIKFSRFINNIPYEKDGIYMFVDGNSGKVSEYSESFNSTIKLPDSNSVIDKNSAQAKYISAMGLELRYNKYISDKKITAYLAYVAKEDLVINAETGNIIPVSYSLPTDGYFDITYMSEKTSGVTSFESNVLSTTDADKIARSIDEFKITDKYSATSANYLRSQDGTYLITISYTSGNINKIVTLNAASGVPVEYKSNGTTNPTGKTVAQTEKISNFTNKYYHQYIGDMIKSQNTTNDHTIVLYERLVNGIPYKSNGLYICFDNHGNLTNLSFAWDNITFPSTENILSADKAYESFFRLCGLELSYFKRNNNELVPIYKKSASGTGIIDANLGIQLNYDGTDFYKQRNYNYLDIDSHYSKTAASKLYDCDIYASSGNVYLKNQITQQEYLLLISELISGTKPILNTTGVLSNDQREMLYTYMVENNIIEKSEINYKGYVTRADAVKYLINILGYGPVAEVSEIFVPHFSDTDKIPAHLLGYVELARSMGIVNGDIDNTFRPNDHLSNGDSLIMIYNYLRG